MKISLIVAMAENRVIGLKGKMPWHLSADLKHFKNITLGHPILMGRKTHEAIGRALPGRDNIVISKNRAYQAADCMVFHEVAEAFAAFASVPEIFVIGGATLYELLLPQADCLYLTQIEKTFQGDTYFPDFNPQEWQELTRRDVIDDCSVSFSYRFLTLQRIKP